MKVGTAGMTYINSMRTPWGECFAPRAALNIVVTPLHWITAINVRVDAATKEELQADLTWMLRRPYTFLPTQKFRDHCQLAPSDLEEWLYEQAAIPTWVQYEHQWASNYERGPGLPVDWFIGD